MHEQKSKNLSSSKCQISPERRVLDLESEVQGFNTHSGNVLLLNFLFLFSFTKASDAITGIIVNYVYFV